MNKNIKIFAEFEDESRPHRQIIFGLIVITVIFLGLLYFASYNIRWLFYLASLISGILFLLGLPLLFIDTYIYRKLYYTYLSVFKLHTAFLSINMSYAVLATSFDIEIWSYFLTCVVIVLISIILYFLNKKQIEKGLKFKNQPKTYFGLIVFICVCGRIIAKTFLINMDNGIPMVLVSIGFFVGTISFLNAGVKDILKCCYIKRIENEN